MAALQWDITVEQGSYEPQYITITAPGTGTPIDLTATGYTVAGAVATRRDGTGTVLLNLPDSSWRRTATGRIYFEPSSAVSAGWTFRSGWLQVELSHPSGQTVRVAQGLFSVAPEIVKP